MTSTSLQKEIVESGRVSRTGYGLAASLAGPARDISSEPLTPLCMTPPIIQCLLPQLKNAHTSGRLQGYALCFRVHPLGIHFLLEMALILSCPFITTRGQPRSRNFMPRIHGGLRASSLPLRQWAGEPHS